MMKIKLFSFLLLSVSAAFSQSASDLFNSSDVDITYLGIDYSHVKLVGEFAQFGEAGDKDFTEIKEDYFPGWNNVVLSEREKYDLSGALQIDDMKINPEMIMNKNAETDVDALDSYSNPNYKKADIEKFVKEYELKDMKGIGLVFVAESLNKYEEEGIFHLVAFNVTTKEVLLHERLVGKPGGFGLRNYWIRPVYNIIKDIDKKYYKSWKNKY